MIPMFTTDDFHQLVLGALAIVAGSWVVTSCMDTQRKESTYKVCMEKSQNAKDCEPVLK